MAPTPLTEPIQRRIDQAAADYMQPEDMPRFDFTQPVGEAALIAHDSISWQVFKNPISLFIGGVTAVILELVEARVRAGVWDHTSFRTDPVPRLKRTGLAAMVTVYAPASKAEAMIAGIRRRHSRVTGLADDGRPYHANDIELLDWVQATAGYGFTEAFHRFVRPLSALERDNAWAGAYPTAILYGAVGAPQSEREWQAQLAAMTPRLTPSPIVFEFLDIMRKAKAFPAYARPVQHLLIRAAIDLVPPQVADIVGLKPSDGLAAWQVPLVKALARGAERIPLRQSPAAQSCVRLGLPADYLYRRR
ncbi:MULTISPECIES: oxygenase MpaB family protein [unclassified Brevundimonas]|uniref:oxygenase MpaB family protein n=1 Tax=unclassified Brevundimonas TaxID=2622653 RepID=UPI0025C5E1C0|nr:MULTISPECIES: oxygenase MpaB family protein [unclassified Brevundimonas]